MYVPPPAQGDAVLVEPRPNSVISDPLTVSGYSRNPEAANAITLTGPHGKVLVRRTVRSNDWNHTGDTSKPPSIYRRSLDKGL